MKKLMLAAIAALSLTASLANAAPNSQQSNQQEQRGSSSNMLPGDYGLNGGGG